MSRVARLFVPGLSHHVTQRDNRRKTAFFGDDDCALYLDLLARRCCRAEVGVLACRPMLNQVHLISTSRRRRSWRAAGGRNDRSASGRRDLSRRNRGGGLARPAADEARAETAIRGFGKVSP